jgi:hypothetical protein
MDGKSFLDIAKEVIQGTTEAHWRTVAGRAYYALMLEGRDLLHRWGFPLPPRDQVHTFVRLRFIYAADPDLKQVGIDLERLCALRNEADYQLAAAGRFASAVAAHRAIVTAETALSRLQQIDSDPARRGGVIASIRARWP